MSLRFQNTLTQQLEEFAPADGKTVRMYTCGPTVYSYVHIGNFRTFLFEDLLRRWLEASGYDVFHIMNLTDVDDRTIAAALKKGVRLRQHVDPFARAFEEDRDWLRILPPHTQPRATEFVPAMIRLIEGLLAKGVAYRGEDGSVYFAIARFPEYGRLSQLDRRELRAGASERVSADEYAKEDARDFVLWKAARPEDEAVGAAWDAPFGRGRPGWHIECSAMALELLDRQWNTDVLDIHAGGVDLIFPHHEDEIAQSCAYTGKPEFARMWLHGEFLNIQGTKMSKRYGNILTARDLLHHVPRRYDDASTVQPIGRLEVGMDATVVGRVRSKGVIPTRSGLRIFQAMLQDTTGLITCAWPGQPWLENKIRDGDVLLVTGPVRFFHGRQIQPREFTMIARGALEPPSERFHWLTSPRSDVLQTSPIHEGITDQPADALERLYRTYVAD